MDIKQHLVKKKKKKKLWVPIADGTLISGERVGVGVGVGVGEVQGLGGGKMS